MSSYLNLHPSINNGVITGLPDFPGGTLSCHCPTGRVAIRITGNVAHNHACGCSKCWKPSGALFSVVGVVPVENLSVTSNAHKLRIIDCNAAIQRNACQECGVHMFGRIVKDHPFKGLDFVHVELSNEDGWQEVQFAAFVSSIIEQGFDAGKMEDVRGKFKILGLESYDCLSPALMDAIAAYTAKQSKLADERAQAVKAAESKKDAGQPVRESRRGSLLSRLVDFSNADRQKAKL